MDEWEMQEQINELTIRLHEEREAREKAEAELEKERTRRELSKEHADKIIYEFCVQALDTNPHPDEHCFDHDHISAYERALRYLLDRGIITRDQCSVEP